MNGFFLRDSAIQDFFLKATLYTIFLVLSLNNYALSWNASGLRGIPSTNFFDSFFYLFLRQSFDKDLMPIPW